MTQQRSYAKNTKSVLSFMANTDTMVTPGTLASNHTFKADLLSIVRLSDLESMVGTSCQITGTSCQITGTSCQITES